MAGAAVGVYVGGRRGPGVSWWPRDVFSVAALAKAALKDNVARLHGGEARDIAFIFCCLVFVHRARCIFVYVENLARFFFESAVE